MKPKPMRIALISEHASPLAPAGGVDAGGQNVHMAQIARSLAAAGHRVDVLTRRDDPHLPATVELRRGVRVLHLDAGPPSHVPKEELLPHMPAFAEAARRLLLHSAGYDVLHANFFMSGWVGLALRSRFNVPLVTTLHGLGLVRREHQRDADRFPPERVLIERQLVGESDRLIAECPQDEADLMRLYGAAPERITNVHRGVDTDAFRPGDRAQARQRLNLPAHEFILLQVGRLVPRKDLANAVRALALLPPELPVRLVVVGGGSADPDEAVSPEIAHLRGVAHTLGVAGRLQFAGRRDHHALRALADKLMLLQRNPTLTAAMGRAGTRRVRTQFTWEHAAQRLLRVYGRVRQQQVSVGSARRPTLAWTLPTDAVRSGNGALQ